jgi:hypothetical protein
MTYRRKIVRGSVIAIVTLTVAAIVAVNPPTPSQAKPPAAASARDELRAKIAALRGEVGLLKLETDADRARLFKVLKAPNEDMEKIERVFSRFTGIADDDQLREMFEEVIANDDRHKSEVEALKKTFDEAVAKVDQSSREKILKQLRKIALEIDQASYNRDLDRLKNVYKERLTTMAEKELLLEDALKRYREAE